MAAVEILSFRSSMFVTVVDRICGKEWFALSARLNVKSATETFAVLFDSSFSSHFVSFWQYIERLRADPADMKRGYFNSDEAALWLAFDGSRAFGGA